MRVLIVVVTVFVAGCAHFRVVAAGHSASTAEETRRVHTVAWGALVPRIEPDNCHGNGLAQVTVRTTFIDSAVAVITLGFWTPVTVQWTCAKAPGGVSR